MGDDMTIDVNGIIAIGEDTGNAAHNPKVWPYNTNTGALTQIFESDPTKFGNLADGAFTPATAPFTSDKEVSGMLDVTSLFKDATWYKPGSTAQLADYQPHFDYPGSNRLGAELVEGGQLDLLVSTPQFAGTPGSPSCHGQSVAALARQSGGLNAAATGLGFPSVRALQTAINAFCRG
jgi:hypothetical protein